MEERRRKKKKKRILNVARINHVSVNSIVSGRVNSNNERTRHSGHLARIAHASLPAPHSASLCTCQAFRMLMAYLLPLPIFALRVHCARRGVRSTQRDARYRYCSRILHAAAYHLFFSPYAFRMPVAPFALAWRKKHSVYNLSNARAWR